VYLCRPNNPTGTEFGRAAVERVCAKARGIVLIDEAYADFGADDFVQHALASDNVIVLRTLSKAFGLAGLRVGYAIGPARLIAEVEKSRGPYKVSGIAEHAALAALAEASWVDARVADVRAARDRLRGEFERRGVRVWDSAANFLLVSVPGRAAAWNVALRARAVAVRPFAALPVAGEAIRVSVGPWPMMQQFLDAFDEVLATVGES
jgi:histidinol-phosphate/aromatic aminotransferase/cobyric acid decarboxylase-like protein